MWRKEQIKPASIHESILLQDVDAQALVGRDPWCVAEAEAMMSVASTSGRQAAEGGGGNGGSKKKNKKKSGGTAGSAAAGADVSQADPAVAEATAVAAAELGGLASVGVRLYPELELVVEPEADYLEDEEQGAGRDEHVNK